MLKAVTDTSTHSGPLLTYDFFFLGQHISAVLYRVNSNKM